MNERLKTVAILYLLGMTLAGFVVMGIDKQKAIKKEWRISERSLLLIAYLGGGIGSLLGMYAFRHKTKHIKFLIFIPISAAVCAAAFFLLL